jgi:cell division protein FtsB
VRRLRIALRLLGRIVIVAVVGAFVTVVGLQYSRIIGRNLAMAGQLAAAQNDIRDLEAKRAEQQQRIRRLSDPAGAVPEIHDKLHLVSDREAIIYLKQHDAGP